MRWPWLLCLLLAASPALATEPPEDDPPPAEPPPVRGDLWQRITEPHAVEIRMLISKARLSMRRADAALAGDAAWAVDTRARFYRDAYHLAARARQLAPDHVEVLAVLARAAAELGKTDEAIAALERATGVSGPKRLPLEVTAQLGALYLGRGELERAIRWLRPAQGPLTGGAEQAHALVHLATALARHSEPGAAAQALAGALPRRVIAPPAPELALIELALAVLYDREEQRGAAFEVIDHLQSALGAQYLEVLQLGLAQIELAPPEELLYFRALLYESAGYYIEARAEWALYAAAGDPPYRARALDHIAAIDAQRHAAPGVKPSLQVAPRGVIPRRLPTP